MITWVLVDVIQLFYLLRQKGDNRYRTAIVLSYGVRTTSVLLLMVAAIQTWQSSASFSLTRIPIDSCLLFLLAQLAYRDSALNPRILQEPNLHIGAGNIIQLVPVSRAEFASPAACIPVNGELQTWMPLIMGLLAISALYAAFRWFSASRRSKGVLFGLSPGHL